MSWSKKKRRRRCDVLAVVGCALRGRLYVCSGMFGSLSNQPLASSPYVLGRLHTEQTHHRLCQNRFSGKADFPSSAHQKQPDNSSQRDRELPFRLKAPPLARGSEPIGNHDPNRRTAVFLPPTRPVPEASVLRLESAPIDAQRLFMLAMPLAGSSPAACVAQHHVSPSILSLPA